MDIGNVIWNPTDKCWHLFPEINFHTDRKEKKHLNAIVSVSDMMQYIQGLDKVALCTWQI